MSYQMDDVTSTALWKKQTGRGMKNSEITALKAFERIQTSAIRRRKKPSAIQVADTASNMLVGKDRLFGDPNGGGSGGGVVADELHYNDGTTKIDIDGDGIRVENLSTGKVLTIDPSLITEDMGIVEDAVCDSGTPRLRLIIASAPYGP